ncbi:ribonuclease P protein component [Mesonia sp. MT50]|uniref:Ribonuclease P protein component n=1 Tax=Mesonia profundi TaxID=3070998 RepID=A0ABU1A0H5_9FLAO|nr:ribonuclease P protein component [Mesonia profundi]MDQ7916498.1 ribonuclease P protein component [Mesonia profundi]
MKQGYPKEEKLKSKIHIGQLFEEGRSVKSFPLKLMYHPIRGEEHHHKVGVSVPKRNFKLAVTRNRIKRLLRENYRKQKNTFPAHTKKYSMMFIYTGRKELDYNEIEVAMKKLIHKFIETELKADAL